MRETNVFALVQGKGGFALVRGKGDLRWCHAMRIHSEVKEHRHLCVAPLRRLLPPTPPSPPRPSDTSDFMTNLHSWVGWVGQHPESRTKLLGGLAKFPTLCFKVWRNKPRANVLPTGFSWNECFPCPVAEHQQEQSCNTRPSMPRICLPTLLCQWMIPSPDPSYRRASKMRGIAVNTHGWVLPLTVAHPSYPPIRC